MQEGFERGRDEVGTEFCQETNYPRDKVIEWKAGKRPVSQRIPPPNPYIINNIEKHDWKIRYTSERAGRKRAWTKETLRQKTKKSVVR